MEKQIDPLGIHEYVEGLSDLRPNALTLTGLELSYGVHNCGHAAATRV
jgi:hypothetical protein